jgi:hypothetical protein
MVLHCLVVVKYIDLDPGSPSLVKHYKARLLPLAWKYPLDASLTHQVHRCPIVECLSGISYLIIIRGYCCELDSVVRAELCAIRVAKGPEWLETCLSEARSS